MCSSVSARRPRTARRPELSQHFLRSSALAASLVQHSTIAASDIVVEVGPGRGLLTFALAARCRRVVAVEVDGALAARLARLTRSENVEVVHDDFLGWPYPTQAYKVFANPPYGRTAAILRRVTESEASPDEAYLIVQREAAERFAGRPHAQETLQSLLLKPWWHAEIVRHLRRTDFEPVPNVDSVVLWLARRGRPLVSDSDAWGYRAFVVRMLRSGAPTARDALRRDLTRRQTLRLARDLGFEASAKPTELSFDQWLGVYRFVALEGSA